MSSVSSIERAKRVEMPRWWNWQTRTLEVRMPKRLGGSSPLRGICFSQRTIAGVGQSNAQWQREIDPVTLITAQIIIAGIIQIADRHLQLLENALIFKRILPVALFL